MLSNGVKVVFEKCGCSHEVYKEKTISMYNYCLLNLVISKCIAFSF